MATTRTERRVLGGAVRRIREAHKEIDPRFALDPIARKAGISPGYWCNIEAGRKRPTRAVMIEMARALDVDLDDITYLTAITVLDDDEAVA